MDSQSSSRPYFIWDYDLTDKQIGDILNGSNETEKIWILGRILESAKLEDVWRYTSYRQVREMFPKLDEIYWGATFWADGFMVKSAGEMTDKVITEYVKKQR